MVDPAASTFRAGPLFPCPHIVHLGFPLSWPHFQGGLHWVVKLRVIRAHRELPVPNCSSHTLRIELQRPALRHLPSSEPVSAGSRRGSLTGRPEWEGGSPGGREAAPPKAQGRRMEERTQGLRGLDSGRRIPRMACNPIHPGDAALDSTERKQGQNLECGPH